MFSSQVSLMLMHIQILHQLITIPLYFFSKLRAKLGLKPLEVSTGGSQGKVWLFIIWYNNYYKFSCVYPIFPLCYVINLQNHQKPLYVLLGDTQKYSDIKTTFETDWKWSWRPLKHLDSFSFWSFIKGMGQEIIIWNSFVMI